MGAAMLNEIKTEGPEAADFRLEPERIDAFLNQLSGKVKREETVKLYMRSLKMLWDWLPEDRCLNPARLKQWRDEITAEGKAAGTVNTHISAANSLLEFYGRRDLQLTRQLPKDKFVSPELTRAEYQRLLTTARSVKDEKAYFAIKLFGDLGLRVMDFSKVTVESVREGRLILEPRKAGGEKEIIRYPKFLQKEMLNYAARCGLTRGPLLGKKDGTPLERTHINVLVKRVSHDARVSEEKATPKCLREMYLRTREGIEADISTLIEMAYERLLEKEQLAVGWDG